MPSQPLQEREDSDPRRVPLCLDLRHGRLLLLRLDLNQAVE